MVGRPIPIPRSTTTHSDAALRDSYQRMCIKTRAKAKFTRFYKTANKLHAANGGPIAAEALRRIGQLYAIEQQAALPTPAPLQLRQEQAKPLLADWHVWLHTSHKTVAAGSGTAKAIDYTLKRWPALLRYAESGTLPIDNKR